MQLLFHEGVGDHRTVLVDISTWSLIGKDNFKVVRPYAQRLSSTNPDHTLRYISYVKKELAKRQLHSKLCNSKLCEVSERLHANPSDNVARADLNNIDRQTT